MTATLRSQSTAAAPTATRDVDLARDLDAPRDLVFRLWVEPALLAQWWGPHGFSNPVCTIDARQGGAMRIDMKGPDGTVYPMTGTVEEVAAPARLVFTAEARDRDGGVHLSSHTTVSLDDSGGRTRIAIAARAVGYSAAAPQMLAGMAQGWSESLERLAELASRLDAGGAPAAAPAAHPVVSREQWLAARKALLAKEKAHTRAGDALAAERRALPWVKVDKDYVFDTPAGKKSLADLFAGRSQLVVYHFMLAPGEKAGCPGCSFLCDHVDGARQHFEHHDVKFVAVSRAPLGEIEAYRRRMGWRFDWVSSGGSDFNYDYGVSFRPEDLAAGKVTYNYAPAEISDGYQQGDVPGASVFFKDEDGTLYHTYSTYGRGGDILIGAHNWLDLTPKGRNESSTMNWMRRHDEYDDAAPASCCH